MKPGESENALLENLRQIVGSQYVLETESDLAAYIKEPRGYFASRTDAAVFPATAAEVAAIVTACGKYGV